MADDIKDVRLPVTSPDSSTVSHPSPASPSEAASSSTPPADRRANQLVGTDGLYKYSCVVCATRKIKCDRRNPCGNCTKAGSACIYRAPAPPRRRKKGASGQSTVLERLKRAEEMLAEQQAGSTPINQMLWRLGDMQLEKKGQLISHNNSSRYLDNSMWIWLNDELRDIRSVIEDETTEADDAQVAPLAGEDDPWASMLLDASPKSISLQEYHPSPVQIFQLWQIYLQNVQPIIKILHYPTAQQQIIDATSHLDDVPRPLEALMFSIYYLVVISLTEEECEERFQESRSALIARYRQAVKLALLRADFLTSHSITVLQAYMIYLVSLRTTVDPAAMWVLSGIAIRMGHRMGLHRDGEALGLPAFDVEVRRRIWWEMIFFDSRTAQLSGAGGNPLSRGVEYQRPRNINDSELFPGMKGLPVEHEGITEMVLAMMRSEIGNFLISFPYQKDTFDGGWQGVTQSSIPLAEKDRMIDELGAILKRKYITKCDPSIPQHLLAISIAQGAMSNIRFMAHNPREAARGANLDPQEEQLLMDCSCSILEHSLFIQTEPSLRKFLYYTRMHFQYLAMVYLLKRLRTNTQGPDAERAWKAINGVYGIDPPIIPESPRSLYKAICDLTLSAWDSREAAVPGIMKPAYIEKLRQSKAARSNDRLSSGMGGVMPNAQSAQPTQLNNVSIPNQAQYFYNEGLANQPGMADLSQQQPRISLTQQDPMDWSDWDGIMQAGDIESIDFASLTQEFLAGPRPIGGVVPPNFASWGNPNAFT